MRSSWDKARIHRMHGLQSPARIGFALYYHERKALYLLISARYYNVFRPIQHLRGTYSARVRRGTLLV